MALFSERYGYIKPSDVIIREQITPDIQNAILSCYDRFKKSTSDSSKYGYIYTDMENYIWTQFLNYREADYKWGHPVICEYLTNPKKAWNYKIDIIEFSIKYAFAHAEIHTQTNRAVEWFVKDLNEEFERLKFAYRIINREIAEITAKEEIVAIEEALSNSKENIREHLSKALGFYAIKPIGEYCNSIKESITAVEAMSRNITGDNVLNFKKMEEKGLVIPSVLRQAFEKLYGYTNDKSTGIRHALMDDEGLYVPQAEEALFMLVSCSAFINYLNKKVN